MRSRVLVVDNESQNAKVTTTALERGGYDIQAAHDVEAALCALQDWRPGAILTNPTLPLVEVIDLCTRVRQCSNVSVIVVSNEGEDGSEIAALDAGANDFVRTPLNTDRLLARLRVALRGEIEAPEPPLGIGKFLIDFHDRRVRVHGQPVRLTPKEFDLFVFLARNPNRVIPHKTLLGAVWGQAAEGQSEYLRVFVGQLRKKLESDPAKPQYLVTEPWVGYRFNPAGTVQ